MRDQEIARRRLHNQRIASAPFAAPEEVVRWLGAVQSQEYAVAKWSVGQRMEGAMDAALDQALANGSIVRTHILRPTWHFVAPADIRWMMTLTAPRVHAMNAHYYRTLELDEAVFSRSNTVLAGALEGGRTLTRKEIKARLDAAGVSTDGYRFGYLLMRAELDAVICSGGLSGKQHTYALFDERVPPAPSLTRDEALAELTKCYFTSHGPATLKDFRWWSSLTAADAKRGVEIAGSDLERMTVGDRTYWLADGPEPPEDVSPTVHLLQCYDEYVVAYTESRGVLDVAGTAGAVLEGPASFIHVVILDGQVVGRWRRVAKAKSVTIEVQLLRSLDNHEQEALDAAVTRYGRFAGLPVSWQCVTP